MNKPLLSQLLAVFQLAAMQYEADQTDHKRQVRDQAETEYKQALQEADLEPVAVADQPKKTDLEILQAIVDELDQAYQEKESQLDKLATKCANLEDEKQALANECKQLYADKMALVTENSLLKNKQIEKDQKIDEPEKSALSATPATVETAPAAPAPAAAPEAAPALTAYQKGLITRQNNLAKVAAEAQAALTTEPTADDSKKNS